MESLSTLGPPEIRREREKKKAQSGVVVHFIIPTYQDFHIGWEIHRQWLYPMSSMLYEYESPQAKLGKRKAKRGHGQVNVSMKI